MTDPCLTCWRRCSLPHAHHTLACRSTGKDELSRRWCCSPTRSLAQALGRTNCLVGAGQTPASCSLLKLTSRSLLLPWLSFSLSFAPLSFASAFPLAFPLAFLSPAFLLRMYLSFVVYLWAVSVGAVCPKLTPPHLRMVTMMTRVLSKKVSVGARERMLLRKYKGGLQSS